MAIRAIAVVQWIVAEIQDALHGAIIATLNNPFQILWLEVGDANMTHHAFLAEGYQGG